MQQTKNTSAKGLKREAFLLLRNVVLFGIFLYLLLAHVFLITQVQGNDMFPAVKDGDLIIGFRWQNELLQNDVVVYEQDGALRTARVIAKENDVVAIDQQGTLRVNGTVQAGEILYPTYTPDGKPFEERVQKQAFYLLGDFRKQAVDSRTYGSIPQTRIRAKVITLLRRRGI